MAMRSIFGCLMVLFLAIVPAMAQDQQAPIANAIVAKMQAKLNLTPDQVSAVTPIIEKYASQRQQLKQNVQDGTLDHESMRTQMKQLKEDEKQELSQVLSSDQMSQFEQMMRKPHGQGHGGGASNSSGDNSSSGQ